MQLAFAEMMRIGEALFEQAHGVGMSPFGYGLLCQFHACKLILCRHLAFAALPGVEYVGVELGLSLLILSCLVEQSNLLEQQVVAPGNEVAVFS